MLNVHALNNITEKPVGSGEPIYWSGQRTFPFTIEAGYVYRLNVNALCNRQFAEWADHEILFQLEINQPLEPIPNVVVKPLVLMVADGNAVSGVIKWDFYGQVENDTDLVLTMGLGGSGQNYSTKLSVYGERWPL